MANPTDRDAMLQLELRFLRLQSERHAATSRVRQADLRIAHVVAEYAAIGRLSRPGAAEALGKLLE